MPRARNHMTTPENRPTGWREDALKPIPLTILTGFLGAGKTTRLNAWLKDASLSDTLVIINEFGDVGLDHLLMEAATGEMILMAAGCMCCTIRGDLVATLEDLLRRRDNQRLSFARIVIETTGLADPVPILQAVIEHPYLAKRFALTSIVTVIDAVNGLCTLNMHAEARRQIALADLIVLTKADLASSETSQALIEATQQLNPVAPMLHEASALDVVAPRFSPDKMSDTALLNWLEGEGTPTPHRHEAGHDANRHGYISTFALIHEAPVSLNALTVFREAMRVLHGTKLLRMKGIVAIKNEPDQPAIIHCVQHIAHPTTRLARWPGRDHRTRIVFITQGLDQKTILSFWSALVTSDQTS
jgi:G3E family GTPase